MYTRNEIEELIGKTFDKVFEDGDEMYFMSGTDSYKFYHCQDCCESVGINDIIGDLEDLMGTPILAATEDSNAEDPGEEASYGESYTWTFYNFSTIKGSVTVRWLGTSNGYYSESVDFCKIQIPGGG